MTKGIAVRRKFNGKVYTYATLNSSKRKAQEIASDVRRHGHLARVVKSGSVYLVYTR